MATVCQSLYVMKAQLRHATHVEYQQTRTWHCMTCSCPTSTTLLGAAEYGLAQYPFNHYNCRSPLADATFALLHVQLIGTLTRRSMSSEVSQDQTQDNCAMAAATLAFMSKDCTQKSAMHLSRGQTQYC